MSDLSIRRKRLENALWGLFIGDALSMPAHWYYDPENIQEAFAGGIRGYVAPPHPHAESFMVGMPYHPDIETAERLRRPWDILHEHVRFYDTDYAQPPVERSERETRHGNAVPPLQERYHYHHGLEAGENTLGAHLVRLVMRSVIRCGRYDQQCFLDDFVNYLTTPGANRDPYTEYFLRRWFENYSRGLPPHSCAEAQRRMWSIGSHGGMIRPLVTASLAETPYQGLGLALEHQNLTHRSENVAAALGVTVPLFHDLLAGAEPRAALSEYGRRLRLPQVSGRELSALYREHEGPGNIPAARMWQLHTALKSEPFDLGPLLERANDEVIGEVLSTACYPEHGVPLIFYLLRRHDFDTQAVLLANANAGGDNVNRGMVLGLLAGAVQQEVPAALKSDLVAWEELEGEIEGFCDLALEGGGI